MSQDFGKGKIYKITNDYNDEVYVGSTCDTLLEGSLIIKVTIEKNDVKTYQFIN